MLVSVAVGDNIFIFDKQGTYCIIPILFDKLGNVNIVGRDRSLRNTLVKDHTNIPVYFESIHVITDKLEECRINLENILMSDIVGKSKISKCLYYLNRLIEHIRLNNIS